MACSVISRLIFLSALIVVFQFVTSASENNTAKSTSSQDDSTPRNKPSQEKGKPPLITKLVDSNLQLTTKLVDSNQKIFVWKNLSFQIVIKNSTDAKYSVKNISYWIPDDMFLECEEKDNKVNQLCKVDTLPQLEANGSYYHTIELKEKSLTELGTKFYDVLTYTPRKKIIQTTIIYSLVAEGSPEEYASDDLELTVEAHPIGMYAGAVVGAFLIAILKSIIVLRERHQNKKDIGCISLILNFFLSFFMGIIATAIAILVFQTTSTFEFAVAINVKDFYGGVLLGLFGEQVALSIYQKVQGNAAQHWSSSI